MGKPTHHVMRSHTMAPISPARMTYCVQLDIDEARADGRGDSGPEQERGDEVEECRPNNRLKGRQNARRHNRRAGIRGIVEAVDEIEQQRYQDDQDRERVQLHVGASPSIDDSGSPITACRTLQLRQGETESCVFGAAHRERSRAQGAAKHRQAGAPIFRQAYRISASILPVSRYSRITAGSRAVNRRHSS